MCLTMQLDVITDNIGRTIIWSYVARVRLLLIVSDNLQLLLYFTVELDDNSFRVEFICMHPLSWC